MMSSIYLLKILVIQGKSPLCVKFPHPTTTLRKLKPFCQKPGCDVVDTLPWNLAFCAKENFGQINLEESLSEGEPARSTTANEAERHQTLKCKVKAYFNYNYDTIHY
jgi:hypothetical protein